MMSRLLLKSAAWIAKRTPPALKRLLYSCKPLADLTRWSLNKVAPTELTEIEIAAGGLVGAKMFLDLQAEKDYWLGTYEGELQAAIADFVHTGMVTYDVGANIGYISLMLARVVREKGKVYAFEALPDNINRLRKNISLNHLEEIIEIVPSAVIDERKTIEFLVGPSDGMGKAAGSAGRTEFDYPRKFLVSGISLDQFVYQDGNPPPDLVKLDIEGGEVLALPGMRRTLNNIKPTIFLELHGKKAAEITWNVLSHHNYKICSIRAPYHEIPGLESLNWKAYLVAFPTD